MYIHILSSGNRFLCGLRRDGERSCAPLASFKSGELKPSGDSRWCPICRHVADPDWCPQCEKEQPCAKPASEPGSSP